MLHPVKAKSFFTILFLFGIIYNGFGQKTQFLAGFAPTEQSVTAPEASFRDVVSLNGSWRFYPLGNADQLSRDQIKNPVYPPGNGWETTPVKVPSPWNVNSFATERIAGGDFVTYPSYPKKWEDIQAGWLSRKVTFRKGWAGKRLILRFEGVGGFTQVYLNKKKIAENFDVFLPFEVDVTTLLNQQGENELSLWVADGRLLNQPGKFGNRIFVGGSFWGQHVRGIWQDVDLLVKPAVYVASTYIQPFVDKDTLAIRVTLKNTTTRQRVINLSGSISPWINLAGKSVIEAPEVKWKLGKSVLNVGAKNIIIAPNSDKEVVLKLKVNRRLNQWAPETPNLYGLVISSSYKGSVVDKQYTRFGWRQFLIANKQLELNGKPIQLKGDSWHFMGIPQMTRRYAWAWYSMLKDAKANAVRLHAQPYPAFYLDMADEMGICVLDETALWASDGGPKIDGGEYWKNADAHLQRFILRDRNHPSVFGWSVCNETMAVALNVFNAPDSLVKKQVAQINKWVAITRKLDPTRTWISGDGETNEPTDLPVVIGHYGDENTFRDWSSQGRPWGIGEAGMAYYGTPKQTAEYNGNVSYRSQQGRMQGLATEAIELLNAQKRYHASYLSIFNIVWYSVKPLELGLADTTRKPTPTDGVFFRPYEEGKRGIQPERLGPYTTTLNPGYDPHLPLYKKWALFDAVQRSFADTGAIAESKPTSMPASAPIPPPANAYLMLRSADPDSTMQHVFTEAGFTPGKPEKGKVPLLVIDGIHPPIDAESIKLKDEVLKKEGKVLIWGITPASKEKINTMLPLPVDITERPSTSYLIKEADAIMNNLCDSDLYFSELANEPVGRYGLSGPLVAKGKTILTAANTDWGVWNKQAEYLKTAAVIRSEREAKPDGNTLVFLPAAKGGIYVMAVNPLLMYKSAPGIISKMLTNLGVAPNESAGTAKSLISEEGFLKKALFLGPFETSANLPFEPGSETSGNEKAGVNFIPGEITNGQKWKLADADEESNFSPVAYQDKAQGVGYYSFWVYTPRSLSNLLLEPDMPKVDLDVITNSGINVFLNQKPLGNTYKAMPLEKGWNHVLIETVNAAPGRKMKIKLSSNDKRFLSKQMKVVAYRLY
ncbi:glycoside hydrolase family 2 protein [Mucilaginibacter pedocola]|uniref:Beta-galactosidase n=1 Tax=Mucilaginibacter pedocola TaxID=1792845 RepID=A0A1S9PA05_9SPHI|nr:sugar-binding domain-containing protein [Mucilaginibacter pedocola]OOQ57800.1 hypothetical protein BC343_13535 [Mucilaginibacter pedocola]